MNILHINGSPRGENSHTLLLAEAFLRGLGGSTETVTLSKCRIAPCNGCMQCWAADRGSCVFRDDMDFIIERIMAADVIIESFPLYYFGMPAIMKGFTDRTFCLMRPYLGQDLGAGQCSFQTPRDARLLSKKLVLISSCGYTDATMIFDALLKQYDLLCHGRNYTPLLFPQGQLLRMEQLSPQRRRLCALLEEAGRCFAQDFSVSEEMRTALQKPLVDPRVYALIAKAHWDSLAAKEDAT